MVVNFPHNPTGALPSRPQWDELVAACRTVGAHLFSDEMYRLMGGWVAVVGWLTTSGDGGRQRVRLGGGGG